MTTIVTRAGKGSPLTHNEMDANFTNLNNDKLEASALTPYETIANAAATYETQSHASTTFTTKANNLSDLASASTARTNLGLGTAAIQNSTVFANSGAVTSNGNTMTTSRLLGRTSASTGAIEEVSVGSGLTLSGGSLIATNSGITLATAQNTTSGTVVDFTGIPAWVKRITVMLNGVSLSGTAYPRIQLGTSGVPETSGYQSASAATSGSSTNTISGTSGFDLYISTASNTTYGAVTFTNVSGNRWVGQGVFCPTSGTTVLVGGGKSLAGVLDMIRVTNSGSDTFDAGSVNIMYE